MKTLRKIPMLILASTLTASIILGAITPARAEEGGTQCKPGAVLCSFLTAGGATVGLASIGFAAGGQGFVAVPLSIASWTTVALYIMVLKGDNRQRTPESSQNTLQGTDDIRSNSGSSTPNTNTENKNQEEQSEVTRERIRLSQADAAEHLLTGKVSPQLKEFFGIIQSTAQAYTREEPLLIPMTHATEAELSIAILSYGEI